MSKILGVHIPTPQNLAINGAMDFFQRIETGTLALGAASGGYGADMFLHGTSGPTAKSLTVSASGSVPTQAQSGFQGASSVQVVNNTAISSYAASDYVYIFEYRMEGLDYAKIHGKTATFGFWFNTTASGIFPISFRNNAFNRSYVTTFSASVGWQFITVTIPMDTSAGGTWLFNNSIGLSIVVGGVAGTTFQTLTLNSWQAGNYLSTNTATNWAATAGATINIAQFSILEGPMGFGPTGFARAGKNIQAEMALCQRYFEKSYDVGTAPGSITAVGEIFTFAYNIADSFADSSGFKSTKRSVPTVNSYSSNSGAVGKVYDLTKALDLTANTGASEISTRQYYIYFTGSTAGDVIRFHWTADAGL